MIASILAVYASAAATVSALEQASTASAWTSSADGAYKLAKFDAPALGAQNRAGLNQWKFFISEKSQQKQTIKGFGACVTDSTVIAFGKLSGPTRDSLLRELMTQDGLDFNLMRHTIASSDLTNDPAYTYDDNGGNVDSNLAHFGLGDRGNAMLSMLAEMRRLQPILTILGSPWAPPGWMQLDGNLTGSTKNNNLNHKYVESYAQYFVKYLQAYEKGGVHVDAITLQNEPLNSKAQMPTMYINASESGGLIRDNLGPALRKAGLKTQVWAWDHNTNHYDYPETVLNMAKQYVPAAAWYCYAGNNPESWQPRTRFHDQFPQVEQYMTECYTAVGRTNWVHSSNFNLLPLQNWANGIIAWSLGTYTGGGPALSGNDACHVCTGLVTVDPSSGTYKKEVDYYMMGQFSKFMPRGGKAVGGSGSHLYPDGSGMESVATLNPDGTRTVVIQNKFDHDIWVEVKTESDKQTWNGQVYKKSVTTWVLPKA